MAFAELKITADKYVSYMGDVVTYKYEFFNPHSVQSILFKIEDDIFGYVFDGEVVVPEFSTYVVEFKRTSDCKTITNKARAHYAIFEEIYTTEWTPQVTVECKTKPAFVFPINEAVNTKEDIEVLNAVVALGNSVYEENHALRSVKYAKIIDLI